MSDLAHYIVNLEDERDKLKAENERLQEHVADFFDVRDAFIDVIGTFRDGRDMKVAEHRVKKWQELAKRLDDCKRSVKGEDHE